MTEKMTEYLFQIFPLITALIAMFSAQLLKGALEFYQYKRVTLRNIFTSGGMPSSHTALVVGLTTAIGLRDGWGSTAFCICAVLSLIVMYDAAGVRRATGRQAIILNKVAEALRKQGAIEEIKVSEFAGHTPLEVALGSLLGVGVALLLYL